MIGCSAEDNDVKREISRVFETMGESRKIFWCGALGTGVAAKISNNYIAVSTITAISEAMAIGIRSGVDPTLLHEIIHHSTGQSWMLDNMQPVPDVLPQAASSNGYNVTFSQDIMVKDLALGVSAGEAVGIEPSIARAALEVSREAAQNPKCKVGRVTS